MMFEFTMTDEGEVLYQFVEITEADICPKPSEVVDTSYESSDSDAYYEGTGDYYYKEDVYEHLYHKDIDFNASCSGWMHSCSVCSAEQAFDDISWMGKCDHNEFCF